MLVLMIPDPKAGDPSINMGNFKVRILCAPAILLVSYVFLAIKFVNYHSAKPSAYGKFQRAHLLSNENLHC